MDARLRLAVRAAPQLALAVSLGCVSDVVISEPTKGEEAGGGVEAEDAEVFCGRVKVAYDFIPDCDGQLALVSCVTALNDWASKGCRAEAEAVFSRCWANHCEKGSGDAECEGLFAELQECAGYDPDA